MTDDLSSLASPRSAAVAWLAALTALWLAVRLGTGFDGLVGQDPYAYTAYADRLREWLVGGPPPGSFFWPPGYPVAGAVLSLTGIPVAVSLQVVSALAWLGAIAVGLVWLGRESDGSIAARTYWVLGFGLAPYVLRASLAVMSDLLALTAVLGCLIATAGWIQDNRIGRLLAVAACAGLAVGVRWAAAPVIVPAVIWAAVVGFRRRRLATLAAAACIGLTGLVPHVVLHRDRPLDALGHDFVTGWSPANAIRSELDSTEGRQDVILPNLVAAVIAPVHPGFFLPGIFALPWLRRRDLRSPPARLALASWLTGVVFLAGLPIRNPRFQLLVAPMALLVLAPAWVRMVDALRLRTRCAPVAVFTAVVILQLGLTARALRGPLAADRLEQEVAAAVAAEPPTRLFCFSFTPALEARATPHQLVELWSENPPTVRPGDLVLFAPDRLRRQWSHHRLFRNWERIVADHRLVVLRAFSGGWTLWRVTPSGAPPDTQQAPP